MTDWSAGYVTDIGYTFGYYAELNPQRLALPLLAAGIVPPKVEAACELGFGQGMSINIHAAASTSVWWGTDFNPAQAGFAQELAAASGASARLFDQAFAEFCNRPDLPEFDFIGLHGIWSWISDENRAVIVDFVRRKLKVGGVLYISYNTQPGWAAIVPMRELLIAHSDALAAKGHGIVSRIDAALDFAEKLLATQPAYAAANPQVPQRIAKMKEQNRHYLAHEYFNRDWHPMSVAKMAEWLAPAKLRFAASAHYLDHVDAINLSEAQQALLDTIPDANFRQLVRDFCCNTQFRRDYWIKGVRHPTAFERLEALRAQRLILITPRDAVSLKVTGSRGEASLNEGVYQPILDRLASHKPMTLAQIEQELTPKGITFAQIVQAALILVGKGDAAIAQEESSVTRAKKACDRLNQHLMAKSRASNNFAYLASPVTGGGVTVPRFHQLFLLARQHGRKTAEEWARFAWDHLQALGQRLTKEGKALTTADENLSELTAQAQTFAERQLPILKALQIA
ncbi:class I SAM-dependent methyltransferase [Hydrogenophilus thiooxidans]|uniref:class I SAM-dependent methyltransferase n=1 Tax=Hydrogenophilus thiooxidans TaxID=2820326 RepID=UPI001C22BFFF|nr:class I SAM-dependent methyltransferase [Hydrogenophilus thiooxidans]